MSEGNDYVPTLAIRASEMNGLQFLPKAAKDRMTPCILLAPWVNSSTLDMSIERVKKAFRGRDFILDLDRDYGFTSLDSAPKQRLRELLNPADAYSHWCDFVTSHDHVLPCIQTRGQSEAAIRLQIERYQDAGRSYCFRLNMNRFPSNAEEVIKALKAVGSADSSIILEGGWTPDPLSLSARFDELIGGLLEPLDQNIPIVLSCTSFPRNFTEFDGGISQVPFTNHKLIEQVQRNHNSRKIIFGDWGSTRPRERSDFVRHPLDHIDYPTSNQWCIARNQVNEWDFERAAEAIVTSPEWDDDLGIWGENMIRDTAISEELGINTPQKNVAVRVNIHLHRQALSGVGDIRGLNLDEDWED